MAESKLAPALTKTEKEARDKYVEEYLKDYDVMGAALRMGYSPAYASNISNQWMSCAYTRKRISEREAECGVNSDEERDFVLILAALKRIIGAPGTQNQSAKVAAVAQLAKLRGLEKPAKLEITTKDSGPDLSHLTLEEKLEIKKKLYPNAP